MAQLPSSEIKETYEKYRKELLTIKRERFVLKARQEGYNAVVFMAACLTDNAGKAWLEGKLTLADVCRLYHWSIYDFERYYLELSRRGFEP